MPEERRIEDEFDLRKVPYPYLCKSGWWKRYKERTAWKGDLENELNQVCERIAIFEDIVKDDPSEVNLKQWNDELEKLKGLRSMLLYKHGFLPFKQHGPSEKEKADSSGTADPFIHHTVAAPDIYSALDERVKSMVEERLGIRNEVRRILVGDKVRVVGNRNNTDNNLSYVVIPSKGGYEVNPEIKD